MLCYPVCVIPQKERAQRPWGRGEAGGQAVAYHYKIQILKPQFSPWAGVGRISKTEIWTTPASAQCLAGKMPCSVRGNPPFLSIPPPNANPSPTQLAGPSPLTSNSIALHLGFSDENKDAFKRRNCPDSNRFPRASQSNHPLLWARTNSLYIANKHAVTSVPRCPQNSGTHKRAAPKH